MLVMHGSAWLILKTEDLIASRARRAGTVAALIAGAGYALGGLWLAFGIEGFHFVTPPGSERPVEPAAQRGGAGRQLAVGLCRAALDAIAPLLGFLGIAMVLRAFRSGATGRR